MHNFYDKARLYSRIDEHRHRLGIKDSDYPLHIKDLCDNSKHIVVKECPFKTHGLRGIATKRTVFDGTDIILLNSNRNENEKNFDCGHELVHLLEHRNAKAQTFHCFERTMPNQNNFMEWQANEGAAELILPYKQFVEEFCTDYYFMSRMGVNLERKAKVLPLLYAQKHKVTESFIVNRIKSLEYEICQYHSGTSIDSLEILSKNQLKQKTISLNRFGIYSYLKLF